MLYKIKYNDFGVTYVVAISMREALSAFNRNWESKKDMPLPVINSIKLEATEIFT